MVSRAELLRAHRFARGRIVAAVTSGRADDWAPTRRSPMLIASLLLSLLAFGAAHISHYLRQSPDWHRPGTVIAVRETGAEFVYVSGLLHPVPNYASARLILGTPSARLVSVSRADLHGVTSGPAWGIADAPSWLPTPGDLVNSWAACSDPAGWGYTLFGVPMTGRQVNDVVVSRRGDSYLISDNHRTPYHGSVRPVMHVSDALLSSIPAGNSSSPTDPSTPPGALCAVHRPGQTSVMAQAAPPAARVTTAPARGALVRSETDSSDVDLVVGGLAYRIRGSDALASLGLANVAPMILPADVLRLIPEGAELSRQAARPSAAV